MKKLFSTLCLLLLTNLYAHTLIMNMMDNEDDTITIEGMFSTGESAVDAMIRIEALNSGEVLFQKRLPDDGELTLDIPKEPYQVVLDGGPGHIIVKEGIEPSAGFSVAKISEKSQKKELSKTMTSRNSWSLAYIVLISLTLLLVVLSIIVSKRNTDKIVRMIQENK